MNQSTFLLIPNARLSHSFAKGEFNNLCVELLSLNMLAQQENEKGKSPWQIIAEGFWFTRCADKFGISATLPDSTFSSSFCSCISKKPVAALCEFHGSCF
jgi:hypothetical protein